MLLFRMFTVVVAILLVLGSARELHQSRDLLAYTYTDDTLRPIYHITPRHGWMNDPNGLMTYNGITHIFYQWNPRAPKWQAPWWGHVVTQDLVHFKQLPPALIPDTEYDHDGVFSGSATVLPDEGPRILYTGTSQFAELGFFAQVQALAYPENASDPYLTDWIKHPQNPVITELPPKGTNFQFRDPQTAWRQDGKWLTTIGAQVACLGAAPLYASEDFKNWEFYGFFHSQEDAAPEPCDFCATHPLQADPEPDCSQFGGEGEGRMWEVVGTWEMRAGDRKLQIFKYSDQFEGREPVGIDWYQLSDVAPEYSAEPAVGVDDAFTPGLGGDQYKPRRVDFGDIYASHFFETDEGRLLWIGWTFETSTGCTGTCGDGSELTDERGWQGAQTALRDVEYDEETGELLLYPIPEMERLRVGALHSSEGLQLEKGEWEELELRDAREGPRRAMDIALIFEIEASGEGEWDFEVGVALVTGERRYTKVLLKGAVRGKRGDVEVRKLEMWVDRRKTGGGTHASMQGGSATLPKHAGGKIPLRVLVDNSVLEAFADEGRVRSTSRIYPAGRGDWSLEVFSESDSEVEVSVSADVWEMGEAWVKELEI